MYRPSQLLLLLSAITMLFFACKKDRNKTPGPEPDPELPVKDSVNVFVAGSIGDTAVYWLNGKPTYLSDGKQTAQALAIYVQDKDVYTAGYIGHRACYWKNTELFFLSDGEASGAANAISVLNNNVYVAGDFEKVLGLYTATLWKNGQPVSLEDPHLGSIATGLAIYDGKVYVCGLRTDGIESNTGCVWVDGVPETLPVGTGFDPGDRMSSAYAQEIFIDQGTTFVGGNVYLEGFGGVATYWKNGEPHYLKNGDKSAMITGIYSIGDSLYVCGFAYSPNQAICWVNGNIEILSQSESSTADIQATQGDVYVVGNTSVNEDYLATIWKNGVASHLADKSGYANAIVLQEVSVKPVN